MAPGSRDHLQREVDSLDALAAIIKQDRGISIGYQNVLLNSHVAGQGFLEGHNDANSKDQTLFVNGEDNGDEANSAYEEEETAANDDDHVSWLNGLAPYTRKLHGRPKPGFPTPYPHLAIEPKNQQYRALVMVERSRVGKTLISMMAVAKVIPSARRFSIIVVPPSCVDQWYSEINKLFVPEAVRILVVRDGTVPATTLMKYNVIIISYALVMSQDRKKYDFIDAIANLKKKRARIQHQNHAGNY